MTSNESSDNSAKRDKVSSQLASPLPEYVSDCSEGCLLRLFVQPKARRRQVVGLHLDRLKVAVTEPPDRGKANAAVIELIAELLNVPRSSVTLLRGDTSRAKDVVVAGVRADTAATLLRNALADSPR
ncbi:MAG: DUF167 domain-containing protein [Planctomyces sp.]|nr:DUF167 domain-containing protein [Planctomyces sp.]